MDVRASLHHCKMKKAERSWFISVKLTTNLKLLVKIEAVMKKSTKLFCNGHDFVKLLVVLLQKLYERICSLSEVW